MLRVGIIINVRRYFRFTEKIIFIFVLALGLQQVSYAEMIFVTHNAVDTSDCGNKTSPCRSISKAIQHATNGDHILVGPGIYGDINNDGDFDDPGDENADLGSGCRCMVHINKPLTITSIVGANSTTLNANNAIITVVKITADNVTFGEQRHGFTITGAHNDTNDNYGAGLDAVGQYINIAGNISLNNFGSGFIIKGKSHKISDNLSRNNKHGFIFTHTDAGHEIVENIASNNGTKNGFGHGFSIYGNGYIVNNNLANGNQGAGFLINSENNFLFEGNTAMGNTGQGIFKFAGSNIKSLKNNIFGNLDKDTISSRF